MHFLNHKLLNRISRLILAAVLFTQFSLATQACMSEAHPVMAFAIQAMPVDCAMHSDTQNRPERPNPNACFVHCTASDQTLDTHHAALHPIATMLPVALLPAALPVSFPARIYPSPLLVTTGGPPLYLLLQNFRN